MFEEDVQRLLHRSRGFTNGVVGFGALKAEKLLDELERLSLTEKGQNAIWDSLAAAVGDSDPFDADLRIISIFRALRGGTSLVEIEPRRSPRPSKAKRLECIAEERERTSASSRESMLAATSAPQAALKEASDLPISSDVETAPRAPGKVACRVLGYLHRGYVLVVREGLPGSGASVSRLVPALPRFDRSDDPRYLLGYEEDYKQNHYDSGYGWELENAGWITDVRGVGDHVYCLTPLGADVCTSLFGAPDTSLPSIDPKLREPFLDAVGKLLSGDIDESAFAEDVGVSVEDIDDILNEISWYGDDEELSSQIEARGRALACAKYSFGLSK
jgi:hypothetical protein